MGIKTEHEVSQRIFREGIKQGRKQMTEDILNPKFEDYIFYTLSSSGNWNKEQHDSKVVRLIFKLIKQKLQKEDE